MRKELIQTNTISDLRNELFETIRQLKEGEIDNDTAMVINNVAKTIVETAKAETHFIKVLDESQAPTKFFKV